MELTAERLRELLYYDPEKGVFRRTNGIIAGSDKSAGYWSISVCGRLYLAQKLAWLYVTGEWPARRIAFRNGKKGDCRWTNLRLTGPEVSLTADRLKEILDYDETSGIFRYRKQRGIQETGAIAGQISKKSSWNGGGYRVIYIDGRGYGANRLAWFYVHGIWPADQVDHVNAVRDDNRIANLRLATRTQNMANCRKRANNTTGLKGAYWHKAARRWMSSIQCAGVYEYLGLFDTKEEAHAAYVMAANRLFGEFARAG